MAIDRAAHAAMMASDGPLAKPAIVRSDEIFVEFTGASGVAYRFRSWSEAGKAPFAGNYIVIHPSAAPPTMLLIGVTGDLSRSNIAVQQVAGQGSENLYVRLNVARSVRRQEHDDLVARHPTAMIVDTDS